MTSKFEMRMGGTYHGIMNENAIDRFYLDGAPNGFNAVMAVGVVAAFASVSGDSVPGLPC